jgi:Ran GTPase-activating protein 1
MMAWAEAFRLHNKVKEIKMVQNGIRQEGISLLLSEGLNHASKLQILDLQDNTFTIMGARALAKVVPLWADILELGIGDSLLGAKGGVLLAEALSKGKNQKLETLRLQYNDITAPAIKNLSTAAHNALPALRRIELNGNKFSDNDESIVALQELLEGRKEKYAGDIVYEDDWGLDSLSDLEELDSDEEEEEEEEGEEEITTEERAEKLIRDAEEAQEEPTVQLQDRDVDELASKLQNTSI